MVTLADNLDRWTFAKPLIEAALEASPALETIEDIEGKVMRGHYLLWTSANSAAVTFIAKYPQKKVLMVVHGGGDLGELLTEVEPGLCEYGRVAGCDAIMGEGREGWKRPLLGQGYTLGFIAMYKDLKNV